jgi:gluconokinase
LAEALTAPAATHTPLVLPFLSGERSTGWAADARAVLSGVSAATTAASVYRGTREGVAVTYARIARQLREVAGRASRVVASGRVARDVPGLLQLIADVQQTPVDPVLIKRATLRGTAVVALEVLAPEIRREPPASDDTRRPRAEDASYYEALQRRFAHLYAAAVPPV